MHKIVLILYISIIAIYISYAAAQGDFMHEEPTVIFYPYSGVLYFLQSIHVMTLGPTTSHDVFTFTLKIPEAIPIKYFYFTSEIGFYDTSIVDSHAINYHGKLKPKYTFKIPVTPIKNETRRSYSIRFTAYGDPYQGPEAFLVPITYESTYEYTYIADDGSKVKRDGNYKYSFPPNLLSTDFASSSVIEYHTVLPTIAHSHQSQQDQHEHYSLQHHQPQSSSQQDGNRLTQSPNDTQHNINDMINSVEIDHIHTSDDPSQSNSSIFSTMSSTMLSYARSIPYLGDVLRSNERTVINVKYSLKPQFADFNTEVKSLTFFLLHGERHFIGRFTTAVINGVERQITYDPWARSAYIVFSPDNPIPANWSPSGEFLLNVFFSDGDISLTESRFVLFLSALSLHSSPSTVYNHLSYTGGVPKASRTSTAIIASVSVVGVVLCIFISYFVYQQCKRPKVEIKQNDYYGLLE